MWVIIEIIVSLAIILVFITEFFWPLATNKPLFGSFRKKKKDLNATSEDSSLNEKLNSAKLKAEDIRKTKEEINENLKFAEQLKNEADNLLK